MKAPRITSLRSAAVTATLFVLVATAISPAADLLDVPGNAIVARPEKNALVIWDATLEVAAIVRDKMPDDDAKVRLERDALNVLATELPKLANLETVEVRLIYTRTGAVSPTYGSATFAGIERYATLSMTAADAKSDRGKWKEAAAGTGAPPPSVTFIVSGALPPR